MGSLNGGTDALLVVAIGIIGYFLRDGHQTLRKISARIKSDEEILGLVNGKYLSRLEIDLMIRERDEWRKGVVVQVENIQANAAKSLMQSKEHYEHERNPDAHWTPRERQDLKEKLDAIHQEVLNQGRRKYNDQ